METNPVEVSQSDMVSEIKQKQHFTGKVIKITLAGAIVDIGGGIPGVVHISQIQKEPVKRVEDVIQVDQLVEVWVRRVYPKKNRIDLTMIKPLDLEWGEMKKDMVVSGKVTRLEKFGAFVDIGAERPGLVHISELTHDYIKTVGDVVKEGDAVEVKILDVNRQKKQIKLSMKALQEKPDDMVKAVLTSKAVKEKERDREREKNVEAEPAEKEEPIPTAMEMALRQAMERKGVDSVGDLAPKKKRKSGARSDDLEGIYSRTLKNRVVTK